jgi:hypothetical protein
MDGQSDRKNKEGQANKDPPPQSEPSKADHLGATTIHGRGADHQQGSNEELSQTETNLADRIKKSDRWMIVLTGIIAAATIANVWFFYRESESSARDIEKLTTKAGDMVTAVNKSLTEDRTAIKAILKENHEALAVSEGQIESSLRESTNQSRTSLKATVEQARMDQRAWIGFVRDDPRFLAGEIPSNTFYFANTGKSPALDFKINTSGMVLDNETPFTAPSNSVYRAVAVGPVPGPSSSVIAPGVVKNVVTSEKDGRVLTRELFNELRGGSKILYLFGRATYDVFKRHHSMTFCIFIKRDMATTGDCRAYNDQNDPP